MLAVVQVWTASTLRGDTTLRTYLDLDLDAATGCTVTTSDGVFQGADQRLTTQVDTSVDPPVVQSITLEDCAAGVFAAPAPLTPPPPGWQVGQEAGPGATDVLETYLELPGFEAARLAFTAQAGTGSGEDALLSIDGTSSGAPIIFGFALTIPTLTSPGLLALILTLALASLLVLRRRSPRGTASRLFVLLVLLGAGVASATIVLDGAATDWGTDSALAVDPVGDGPPNADLRRAYARSEGARLFLRLDLADLSTTAIPATANADSYAVVVSGTLNVAAPGVLGNDAGSALTVTQVNASGVNVGNAIAVGGGTLTLNADGSFTYSAPAVLGPVSFTYQTSNGLGSDTATVTVDVFALSATDDGPAGGSVPGDPYHGALNTPIGGPTVYSVVDNDTGPAPLSVTGYGVIGNEAAPTNATPTAQGGSVSLDAAGHLLGYTPASATFIGVDTFKYTMTSASGGSAAATVTIKVGTQATANNDAYPVVVSGTLNIGAPGVLGNDLGGGLTVTQVNGSGANVGNPIAVGGGTLTLNADGSFTYSAPAVVGPVNFTYQTSNSFGSDTATVTVDVFTVSATDDGPAGGSVPGDPYHGALNTPIGGPTVYSVVDNDTGPAPLSVTGYGVIGNEAAPTNATPTAQGGSVTLDAAGHLLGYTPASATFVGVDTFKYTMTSASGGSAAATVTIKVGTQATANNDAYPVVVSGMLNIGAPGVLGNDLGGGLTVTQVNGSVANVGNPIAVGGGTLTLSADGSFSYSAPAVVGPVNFTYQTSNSVGSDTATVTVDVF